MLAEGALRPGQAGGGLRPPLLPRPPGRPGGLQPRADHGRGRPVPHHDQGQAGARRLSPSGHRPGGHGGGGDHWRSRPSARATSRPWSPACSRWASSAAASASTSSPARSTSRARCAPISRRCATWSSGGCGRSSTASPGRTAASFEMEYQQNAPATVNDPALTRRAQPLLERIVGRGQRQDRGAQHGRRGFRLLRQPGPRLLLPARRRQAGHDVGRPAHAHLPRRRQRGAGGHPDRCRGSWSIIFPRMDHS